MQRTEPCNYCKYNPLTLVGKKMLHHGANVQYHKLRVYFENETLETEINFCPMCGRELTPEDSIKRPPPEWVNSPKMEAFKNVFNNKFGTGAKQLKGETENGKETKTQEL